MKQQRRYFHPKQQLRNGVILGIPAGIVSAQHLRDTVLPAGAHVNDCDARTDAGGNANPSGFYTGSLQQLNQLRPENIVAHPPHHCGTGAHPRGGHRLVRAFPAAVGNEPLSHHRLPVRRQPFPKGNQIHINPAQRQDYRPEISGEHRCHHST